MACAKCGRSASTVWDGGGKVIGTSCDGCDHGASLCRCEPTPERKAALAAISAFATEGGNGYCEKHGSFQEPACPVCNPTEVGCPACNDDLPEGHTAACNRFHRAVDAAFRSKGGAP